MHTPDPITEELFRNGPPARVRGTPAPDARRRTPGGRSETGAWRPASGDSEGSSVRDLDVQGLVNTLKARQAGKFQPGDKVRHASFGDGIVVKSMGAGDQEQVSVLFPGHGEKKLAVSIARLDKLP